MTQIGLGGCRPTHPAPEISELGGLTNRLFHCSVGLKGFEPSTFRPPAGRATKLRHSPCDEHQTIGLGPALTPELENLGQRNQCSLEEGLETLNDTPPQVQDRGGDHNPEVPRDLRCGLHSVRVQDFDSSTI
jgi:hypothetical protein